MNDAPSLTPQDQDKERVLRAGKKSWFLIGTGAVLVLLFVGGLVYERAVGSEETTQTTRSVNPGVEQPSAERQTTETRDVPSDTILTGLLAAGVALVAIGALFERITSIKVLGTEIGLTKHELELASETVKDEVPEEDKDKLPYIMPEVLWSLNHNKRLAGVGQLPDKQVIQLVQESTRDQLS